MPGEYFYLSEDEQVLQRLRAPGTYTLTLLVLPVALVAVALAAALAARAFFPPFADAVPPWAPWAVAGALLAIAALAAWRRAATTEYVLTDQRIYSRVGRLVTKLHFTTHDKVTDILYRQGPLERAAGFASLTFATAGGDVQVPAVRDALALKAASERARDAFVRALIGEAAAVVAEPDQRGAPSAGPAPLPAPAPSWDGPRPDYLQAGDVPVWMEKPRPIAAVTALRSVIGLLPVLLFTGAMDPARRSLVLLAAIGIVLVLLSTRLMQLRRTEYVATERRVYTRRGLVGTTVSQLTYDKITDITYQQDLLGRMFGYGSVTVQTAGGSQAPITMIGLGDPLAAKETIERWRDSYLGGRA